MSNELNRRTAPPAPMGEELPALPVFPNGGSATDLVRSVKSLMHKAVSAIPASLATDSPEPLTAIQVAWIVGKFIAPYAERLRQLERELKHAKLQEIVDIAQECDMGYGKAAERKTASIDSPEFRKLIAYVQGFDDGEPIFGESQKRLIAYIEGRTDGEAPEGSKLMPIEPTDDMIVAFAEQWYSKVRCIDDCEMDDCYAAMIAAAPAPMNSGKEEA